MDSSLAREQRRLWKEFERRVGRIKQWYMTFRPFAVSNSLLNEQGCCVNRPSFRGLSLTTKATLTPVSSSPWRFHLRRKTALGDSSRTQQMSTRSTGPYCPIKLLCRSTSTPRFSQHPMLSAFLQDTVHSCRMATACASMVHCTVTTSASTIRNWVPLQSKCCVYRGTGAPGPNSDRVFLERTAESASKSATLTSVCKGSTVQRPAHL